jgi:hypothetical protein
MAGQVRSCAAAMSASITTRARCSSIVVTSRRTAHRIDGILFGAGVRTLRMDTGVNLSAILQDLRG